VLALGTKRPLWEQLKEQAKFKAKAIGPA